MLRSLKSIFGYTIQAKDGDIGRVVDFYFDDERWTVRYLVADTDSWLTGRKVLISPAGFYGRPKWQTREFPVNITREMVKECPDVDTEKPISRQKELELARYYHWPLYWETYPAGGMIIPAAPAQTGVMVEAAPTSGRKTAEDSHLRSIEEVNGYHIKASDGDIGRVIDFIVDDERWHIRYMAVDTNWLPGGEVLIAPHWIRDISWSDSSVTVDLTREQVKGSPVYDPHAPVNREYEERLYDYYGRPKYWANGGE